MCVATNKQNNSSEKNAYIDKLKNRKLIEDSADTTLPEPKNNSELNLESLNKKSKNFNKYGFVSTLKTKNITNNPEVLYNNNTLFKTKTGQ